MDDRNQPTNKTQEPQSNQPKEYKQVLVINDEDVDFNYFLNNLEIIAQKKIPVAIDPNILIETIFASVRQYGFFVEAIHDPNTMSHRILKVMPQMTDITDVNFDQLDSFEGDKNNSGNMFEYPNDKTNN